MSLLCLAPILAQQEISPGHFLLTFHAPEMAQAAQPGQFVHVRCGDALDPLLRRPLSLHGLNQTTGTLTLLYRVVGKGTERLSRMQAGEVLDVMGPLGRGFCLSIPYAKEKFPLGAEWSSPDLSRPELSSVEFSSEASLAVKTNQILVPVNEAVVVGGGIGVAPLLPLVEALFKQGARVTVLLGARSADGLLSLKTFEATGARVEVATDDGSQGVRGNVAELLRNWLAQRTQLPSDPEKLAGQRNGQLGIEISQPDPGSNIQAPKSSCVYACGPAPMLRAIWQICSLHRFPLQVSLEERMGCGVGACLACVCQVKKTMEEGKTGAILRYNSVEEENLVTKAWPGTSAGCACGGSSLAQAAGSGWRYARVCVEGPVFWGEEVLLDE